MFNFCLKNQSGGNRDEFLLPQWTKITSGNQNISLELTWTIVQQKYFNEMESHPRRNKFPYRYWPSKSKIDTSGAYFNGNSNSQRKGSFSHRLITKTLPSPEYFIPNSQIDVALSSSNTSTVYLFASKEFHVNVFSCVNRRPEESTHAHTRSCIPTRTHTDTKLCSRDKRGMVSSTLSRNLHKGNTYIGETKGDPNSLYGNEVNKADACK